MKALGTTLEYYQRNADKFTEETVFVDMESYVYKKELDWSLFNYSFAIPLE